MRKLTLGEQSALNIIGSIVVVAINVAINFLLSPYIVSHLGVEANGYISLANNFVSYIALITIALNSMSGRFILIDYRKGNQQSANEYYSSVLLGDWIIAAVLFIPVVLFVIFIDKCINIPTESIADTRMLFALVFANYFVTLCVPQWTTAIYCTNNLYLRSLKQAVTAIVRALAIYFLFKLFTPHAYYVAIAASAMTVVGITMDYVFWKKLMPQLQWKVAWFRVKKVWELVSSGIWNTVTQCGNLLLEGLDILIANLFISPVASGVLALSKLIPNMINQISGTVATTFGPRLTYLFADGKTKEMVDDVKGNITVVSLLTNIPIGIFAVFGTSFFTLWVPSQDADQLAILSLLSLAGMLFAGISQSVINIFGIVNRLKLNSLIVIASGLINVSIVYCLLRWTDIGIYAIVGVSSTINILRIFCFVAPYAAYCINAKWYTFIGPILKGASSVLIPIAVSLGVAKFIVASSWLTLILAIAISATIAAALFYFIILNRSQRTRILQILHIKK